MTRIQDLGLDPRIAEKLREEGIDDLYPPQEEAIPLVLSGENVVLAVPTASGKSLVAYLAILNSVLRGGKALYIVPLKALASEKYEDLARFESLGIRVAESTGDYDESDAALHKYDVVVATSEKVDSLLRHRSKWLDQLSVVVADEVHMLNDPERGPTLEVILVKFRTFNPEAQLIALSATIKNAGELAEWLGAKLVTSDWRPVPLRQGVYLDGELFFTDNSKRAIEELDNPVHSIVRETLESKGQCLIFVNTRKASESLAMDLGPLVRRMCEEKKDALMKLSRRLIGEQDEPTTLGSKLGKCLKNGAAFHHAGLTNAQRRLVESSFKKGLVSCIVATPTLAAGINLPARTVIVRDVRRYDSNSGYASIPVFEVKQMCGRAGRPRYDPYGEAILVAKDEEERRFLLDEYLLAENENIYSKLGTEPAIRSHVLALIATRHAESLGELREFFGKTFLAHQIDASFLEHTVSEVVDFLSLEKMVAEEDGKLVATSFGRRVSDLYIDPRSAVIMRDALKRYKPGATFGLLHTISSVPDMPQLYLRQSDAERIEEFVVSVKSELLADVPDDLNAYELFLSEIKTAKLLNDWISEVHENDIAEAFGVGPGDIRNKVDIAQWLMHAVARLSEVFNKEATKDAIELTRRITYGIRPELLDLVKLRGIGRVRARALHARGYRNLEDLRLESYDRLKQIPTIGEAVARSIKEQLGQRGEGIPEEEKVGGQMVLRDYDG